MARTPRILAFAGSTRADSFNRKLIQIAVTAAREASAEVTLVDLKHYVLPLFDQDLEAARGLPEAALKLKQLFVEHDGLLIASPEYNSSITPLTKNTIDWVSRGETGLVGFQGKVASLISASPGALGGLRGLVHLRAILGNIGVIVLPDQASIPVAHEAFDNNGALKNEKQRASIANVTRKLVETISKLKNA